MLRVLSFAFALGIIFLPLVNHGSHQQPVVGSGPNVPEATRVAKPTATPCYRCD